MKDYYAFLEDVMMKIEMKWQEENFDANVFPEIVRAETESVDLSMLGEVSNQLKLLDLPAIRQQQHRSTFSDLHLQIFHNGRFMIEVLNWWGGHVNVHDHDFSAVQFQLKGNALNVEYDFVESQRVGALHFGHLATHRASIWKEGDRSLVLPGRKNPHGVFHLGEPTTSLLIRTIPTPRFGAQLNYFPTLAAHYYVSNDVQRKKLTALNLLATSSPKVFAEALLKCLDTQSLSENFFMLLKLSSVLFRAEYIELVHNYADRGSQECQVVTSVAFNCGIDCFKYLATQTPGLSEREKLAAFIVAASHDHTNFEKVLSNLGVTKSEFMRDLNGFNGKLDSADQERVSNYLDIFGICKEQNAAV